MKQLFSIKCKDKNIDFSIDFDNRVPEMLLIDETRLRQILFNLIGNAVKFTETGFVKVSVQKRGAVDGMIDFDISVEDTGVGISRKDRDAIFEAFTQQSGQDTRRFGGTGLGLTITKRVVEILGGTISVRSEQGKGSKFIVNLSSIKLSSENVTKAEKEQFDLGRIKFGGETVLVVDDDKLSLKMATELLEKVNLSVITAKSGDEAVFKAVQNRPNLILTDINMPVMGGQRVAEELNKNETTAEIPIVAMTASSGKQSTIFDGVIYKPIEFSTLFAVLSKHIRTAQRTETFSEFDKLQLPKGLAVDLKALVERRVIPECRELLNTFNVDHISVFARKLLDIGADYDILLFTSYGQMLERDIKMFDLINMERNLKSLLKLLRN